MKIDILFALPGPQHLIQGDKLLVVAAATEHEDQDFLKGVIAEVAEASLESGAYRAIRTVTLELDESSVLALLNGHQVRVNDALPRAALHKAALN